MRSLTRMFLALLFAGVLCGQYRFAPPAGGFSSGLFPSGTRGHKPAPNRFSPNGGSGQRLTSPAQPASNFTGSGVVVVPYAFPVYVGGDAAATPAVPPQSDATVVYASQPAPVIVSQYGSGDAAQSSDPAAQVTAANAQAEIDSGNPEPVSIDSPDQPGDQSSPDHYLIALKDHTVYSVVAYWAEGDTLHYFTPGNVHNQVSLSLVDRAITARLNKETGAEVKLPADQ